jgi:uncharacterized protein with PQ loop repeat
MAIQSLKEDVEQDIEHPAKIAGLLATIVGIISYLPVVYTVYKTKKTTDFPYKALILAIVSNTLWMYYGFANPKGMDKQIMLMGVLYFLIYVFILYTKLIY